MEKTYILKHWVYNSDNFPIGTIVKITDDYWGNKNSNKKNSGFTVVSGELKGKKGCVADGLDGWLIANTAENRRMVKIYLNDVEKSEQETKKIHKQWCSMPAVKF